MPAGITIGFGGAGAGAGAGVGAGVAAVVGPAVVVLEEDWSEFAVWLPVSAGVAVLDSVDLLQAALNHSTDIRLRTNSLERITSLHRLELKSHRKVYH